MSGCDLRLGRWQDVLADVECDALICDPPYSERTHDGYRSGSADWDRVGQDALIGYRPLTREDVSAFVDSWLPRVRRWIVIFGDDVTQRWWQDEIRERDGWLCFAPVVWLKRFSTPRLAGDGPTSSAEWLTIARRRGIERSGALPGFYDVLPVGERIGVVGSKNLASMRELVGHYTRPGDLVCDPCAGGGTTLLAAAQMGRHAVGAEMDPDTYAKAFRRLAGVTVAPGQEGLRGRQQRLEV